MKRPSKKEIRAEVERLRTGNNSTFKPIEKKAGKPSPSKSNMRIRKQGV